MIVLLFMRLCNNKRFQFLKLV